MAEVEQTAEAKKQRRKRKKANEKNAALGVAKFTFEVAAVSKGDLKRLMKQHGINNQQEVYQLLLMNLIAADFETQAKMLRCVTTPFVVSEKVSRTFYERSMAALAADPGDESIRPTSLYIHPAS